MYVYVCISRNPGKKRGKDGEDGGRRGEGSKRKNGLSRLRPPWPTQHIFDRGSPSVPLPIHAWISKMSVSRMVERVKSDKLNTLTPEHRLVQEGQ